MQKYNYNYGYANRPVDLKADTPFYIQWDKCFNMFQFQGTWITCDTLNIVLQFSDVETL